MHANGAPRVGYVLKVYPRLSQTFVLNEILAHQHAGAPVDILSLRLPDDGRFHEALAEVDGRASYFADPAPGAEELWSLARESAADLPGLWPALADASFGSAREVAQAIAVAREVHARRIDHLHAHFGNTATTVARLAARIAGITYSFTAHARDIFHTNVDRNALDHKLADAAAVVTVSEFNRRWLSREYGDSARRVEVVYNGLDLHDFPYSDPTERELLIVGVGRLIEKKGFADLVDACDLLARTGRSFRCEIVGGGLLHDDLARRIAQRGLSHVIELVGPLPAGEVARRVRKASMLAAPCVVSSDGDRDGLPTVLLEAMALGTPCISTDVTGIPELVRDEDTGLAVPQGAPARLAEACGRLLESSDLRVRLARNGRRLIEASFDVKRNSGRLREIFSSVAGLGRRPAPEADSTDEGIRELRDQIARAAETPPETA